MDKLFSKFLGAGLILTAVGFTQLMDNIGEVNMDHSFTVNFQRGTTPTNTFKGIYQEIEALMDANQDYKLVIRTHAGTRGPDAANMKISEDRLAYLVKQFDDWPNRIVGSAHGETETLTQEPHETDALWQKRLNRAELEVTVNP